MDNIKNDKIVMERIEIIALKVNNTRLSLDFTFCFGSRTLYWMQFKCISFQT